MKKESAQNNSGLTSDNQLIEELNTYRIELELQNDELRQAQQDLQTALLKYSSLYDFAPVGFLTISAKGSIIETNLTAAKMLGTVRKHLINQKITAFIVMEDEDKFYLHGKQVLADQNTDRKQHCELRMKTKKGSPFFVSMESIAIREGTDRRLDRFSTVITDITKRRLAEDALRDSEERFRNLAETANDAIIGMDENARVSLWNPAATKIFGFTSEEAIGNDLHALITPKRYRERARSAAKKFFETGTGAFVGRSVEVVGLNKDGTEFPIELSISRMKTGDVWNAAAIVKDIGARKRNEAELAKIDKLKATGILAGGIAHDFNNLLTGILANIGPVKIPLSPDSKDFKRLERAETACRNATDLTQQLLTFSKGGAPVKEIVSLSCILHESVDFCLSGSTAKPQFSISDDLRAINADKAQINHVIQNIIINANQAMPHGGIITISAENIELDDINTLALEAGDYVKVSITDQGTGIPENDLKNIFDPYFSTKEKGHGLGLAVCHSVIQNHRGSIVAESSFEDGSILKIYLPASREQVASGPVIIETLLSDVPGGRILVMDDEDFIRDTLGDLLPEYGFEVEVVVNGDKVIERYKKEKESGHPFNAVVLDLTIPGGIGGEETLKKLLEYDPQVKAIASSGYADGPVMANPGEYGFKGAVSKPYKVSILSNLLRDLLTEDSP